MSIFLEKIVFIIEKEFKINLNMNDFSLSKPPKKDFWDYAFACFPLAKELKKSPNEIAELLVSVISKNKLFTEVSSLWGYLNFFVNKQEFVGEFLWKVEKGFIKKYSKKDETIIIDYIGANVWKPLHIGHLCTPVIGQALINMYKNLWYKVIWDSHLWDWGTFWKLICAWKNAEKHGSFRK